MRFIFIPFILIFLVSCGDKKPSKVGSPSTVLQRQSPILEGALSEKGIKLGAPTFVRVFKKEAELEVWMKPKKGNQYKLFRTYPICAFSGSLGPKLKQGDKQAPEGFYRVTKDALNPQSQFHLSFDLGFPNAFDQSHGRTGDYLMVHGDCVSAGCYAMTDPGIEEIYTLVAKALMGGQSSVPVHAFPFRMSDKQLAKYEDHQWYSFWQTLKEGYDAFEQTKRPPTVSVENQQYVVDARSALLDYSPRQGF